MTSSVDAPRIEVEVKVEADHDEVEPRLRSIGARPRHERTQVDVYYAAPHREFGATDEALRIRTEDGGAYLTYKGRKLDESTKSREEVVVEVGSPAACDRLLRSLGFEEYGEVRKHRRTFFRGDYLIVLDDVEGLGEFVEVETVVPEDEVEGAREGAFEILTMLDLDPGESVRESYLELLEG